MTKYVSCILIARFLSLKKEPIANIKQINITSHFTTINELAFLPQKIQS